MYRYFYSFLKIVSNKLFKKKKIRIIVDQEFIFRGGIEYVKKKNYLESNMFLFFF